MDLGLTGKVALVHGGGGGLGSAIAESLSREGAKVCIAGRTAANLETAADRIANATSTRPMTLPWDLSDLAAIAGNVETVQSELGPVDVLINNTGGPPPGPAAGMDAEKLEAAFRMMVLSVIGITDAILPGMRERGFGRIVTCTSSGVVAPIPNLAMSNVLRQSLVGWSKTLAREVAKDGVTCNILIPGRVATARTRQLDEARAKREDKTVDEVERASRATIPAGRYGDPAEFGDTAAFLASRQASYITGAMIRVDGGYIPSV